MRVIRKMSAFVALATALLVLSANHAAYAQSAGGGLGVVIGSGNISPGLTTGFTPQSVSFAGTVTGGFGAVDATIPAHAGDIGTISCSFSGGSSNTFGGDNYAFGQGAVTGNCTGTGIVTGASITVTCATLIYIRVVGAVHVWGKCNILVAGISVLVIVLATLLFRTGTVPPAPIQNYNLEGVVVAVPAP